MMTIDTMMVTGRYTLHRSIHIQIRISNQMLMIFFLFGSFRKFSTLFSFLIECRTPSEMEKRKIIHNLRVKYLHRMFIRFALAVSFSSLFSFYQFIFFFFLFSFFVGIHRSALALFLFKRKKEIQYDFLARNLRSGYNLSEKKYLQKTKMKKKKTKTFISIFFGHSSSNLLRVHFVFSPFCFSFFDPSLCSSSGAPYLPHY